MSYSLVFGFFGRTAGITDWRAQLVDVTGSDVGAAMSAGFADIGDGFYQWYGSSAIPDGHEGGVKFYRQSDGIVRAFCSINPQEAEYTDSKISAVAGAVWAAGSRTLTSFGTLAADVAAAVWGYVARTLTDKTGFSLSSAGIQAIWDALTSALTTAGSIGKLLVDLYSSLVNNTVTVISAISGDTITVYRNDTWSFTATVSATLTGYEIVAFVVKTSEQKTDDEALLIVRSDTGLQRVDGAAASSANGSLVVSGNQITVKVAIGETDVAPISARWWLKVFDTTPATDEGYTLATGIFEVVEYGYRAIV
jgi:hypothetical protein